MQIRHCLVQAADFPRLDKNIIMLDSCSESSVVMNASLLHDVRDSSTDETIQVLSNGNGSVVFSQLGTLNLFPMTVYLNPSSMANILSLRDVSNIPGVHVTMDTAAAKCMIWTYVYILRRI